MTIEDQEQATATFTATALAELQKHNAAMKPILCGACGKELYVLFAPHLGTSVKADCPLCGGKVLSEKHRLRLSARMGGGIFVPAHEEAANA